MDSGEEDWEGFSVVSQPGLLPDHAIAEDILQGISCRHKFNGSWYRYVPIVALMFWPYAVAPIMQKVMTNL